MKGNPFTNLRELPPAMRSAQMWLNIDDVLELVPIGRSSLYNMVHRKQFPRPYVWNKRPLWSQAMIRDWIKGKCEAVQEAPPQRFPVTWAGIENLLKEKSPRGLTNVQITHLLNAEQPDVTTLTRIMAKAGVLIVIKPFSSGQGSPYFYVYNDGNLVKES